MSKNQLIIFDMTLREGEQSPGAFMTKDKKLRISKLLEKLRVDVIEAGFAIASHYSCSEFSGSGFNEGPSSV